MERSRWGEGDRTSQSPPPMTTEPPLPESAGGEAFDPEDLESPIVPGYLTLELDVSDLQGFTMEADLASHQMDWEMHSAQDPEVSDFEFAELLDLEEPTLPGYLTLEIDLNASGDAPATQSPNDEHRSKP